MRGCPSFVSSFEEGSPRISSKTGEAARRYVESSSCEEDSVRRVEDEVGSFVEREGRGVSKLDRFALFGDVVGFSFGGHGRGREGREGEGGDDGSWEGGRRAG